MTLRLAIAALLFALLSLALGAIVARRPPTAVDTGGLAFRGHGVAPAVFFTRLGRWPALLVLGVLAFGITMSLREPLLPVIVLLGAQVASQFATALLKRVFRRARPEAWLHRREVDLSYPSGHAVSAIVFFFGFALLAWQAPLPRPVADALAVALLICAAGIPWSRLALRAHYVTDVAGGMLFGAAWLSAALATIVQLDSINSISFG